MTTIITKNSSTAGAAPTSSDLVQGELAVNVTDKRLYTENASGTVVELGTNPSVPVTFPDGSASAPSLTNDGDTNTGVYFPAADTVGITTGGTERVRVDSSGNVGIGTSSFDANWSPKLQVVSTASDGSGGVMIESYRPSLIFKDDSASAVRQHIVADSSALLFGSGDASFTERARIDSSGNLLVGTTDNSLTSGAGVKIAANIGASTASSLSTNSNSCNHMYSTGAGAYRFYVGWGGQIYATVTTIAGASDQRLKENIRDLDDGLSEIMALQPRKFDWKEGKGADTKNARGFIAQEFETVFPDLIDEWKDPAPEGEDPYKAVRADLIPVLVKAIQEQQAIITQLQADVAALKGQA